jgi:hypothetical protein
MIVMKLRIYSVILLLMMIGSMAVSLVGSSEDAINNPVITSSPVYTYPGKTHITISPEVLKPLGYNDTAELPEKLLVQIIRSYNVSAVQAKDGDYYCIITPDSPKAAVNLIGTNYTCAEQISLDLSHPPSD